MSNQQLEFIETRRQGENWVAVMADATYLKARGTSVEAVKSQMSAARRSPGAAAQAHTVFRGGIHIMTREQLEQRLVDLKKLGRNQDVQQFTMAIERISSRQGGEQPAARATAFQPG